MESGGNIPPFLTSALDGGEWSASPRGETATGTHCIGGSADPKVCLDAMKTRRIDFPYQEWNPDSSDQSVA
jgi:hypothetical protein